MSLLERLEADLKDAMRARRELERDTLRMTISELKKAEIEQLKLDRGKDPEQARRDQQVAELRAGIEQQLVAMETFVRDHQAMLHKNAIADVEQALKRGRMALLKSADLANLKNLSAGRWRNILNMICTVVTLSYSMAFSPSSTFSTLTPRFRIFPSSLRRSNNSKISER